MKINFESFFSVNLTSSGNFKIIFLITAIYPGCQFLIQAGTIRSRFGNSDDHLFHRYILHRPVHYTSNEANQAIAKKNLVHRCDSQLCTVADD